MKLQGDGMNAQAGVVNPDLLGGDERAIFWEPSRAFLKFAVGYILAVAVIFEMALLILAPEQTQRALAVLIPVSVAAGAWLLIARGRVRGAVLLLSAGVWAYVTVVALYLGGVESTTIIIYPLIVSLIGWLFSSRAAVAVALLTTVVSFGFVLAETYALLPLPAPTPPVIRWVVEAGAILLSAVLISHVVKSYRNRLEEVKHLGGELARRTLELQARETDLNRAQSVAQIGSWVYDIANDSVTLSAEACRILGLPAGLKGSYQSYLGRVHADDRPRVERDWLTALTGFAPFNSEHRIAFGQTTRWVWQNAEMEFDANGLAVRSVGTIQDVSERKSMEEALRASESQLQCILGATADGILAVDNEGKVIQTNRRFAELWQIPQSVLDRKDDAALLNFVLDQLSDAPAFLARVRALYQSDVECTDMIHFNDGRVFERFTGPLVLDTKVVGRVWSFRDITGPQRVQHDLQLHAERLRLAMEAAQLGWFDVNVQTGEVTVSPEYALILGYEAAEFKSDLRTWSDGIHPSDRQGVLKAFDECIRTGERRQMEYRRSSKSGEWVWIRSVGKIVDWDAEGKALRMTGTHADISERKVAEDELLVRDIALKHSLDAVAMADIDGRITYVNDAFVSLWKLSAAEQAMGRGVEEFARNPEIARQVMEQVLRDREWRGQLSALRGDGTHFDVEVAASLAVAADGTPIAMMASFVDISEQQRAKRNLDLAVEVTGVLIWEMDFSTGRFNYDASMLRALQLDAGDAPPDFQAWTVRVHPEDRRLFEARVAQAVQPGDGIFDHEYRFGGRGGEYQWIHTKGRIVERDATGAPVLAVGTSTNVSARKQTEAALARLNAELEIRVVQRTADLETANNELNTFSYTIAHDMRAPVRAINGFSEMVLKSSEGALDPVAVGYLKRVVASSRRMGELIDDLLNLARLSRQELRRQTFSLSNLATSVASAIVEAHPERTAAVTIQPEMTATADPGLIRVVLDNLIGNAWKFTGKIEKPEISIGSEKRLGQTVYHVRDNGAGFDMQYAHKLFLPFQRLHHADEFEGTGIGLATVKKILQRHGGKVWVESATGKGTSVYFTLDVADSMMD